jgi:tRNA splicing ligase
MEKYVVYITYGVYVDTDTTNEEEIIAMGVSKMFNHGEVAVTQSCHVEIENVTKEFMEVTQ